MKRIIVINGPNLNLLGKREPEIYGHLSFEQFFTELKEEFSDLQLEYFQSNSEGALVTKLQEVGFSYDGIVLNPAAYSHTSIAIADAISAISCPVVEVHISNIFAREAYRTHSYVSPVSAGVLSGLGLDGYKLALKYFVDRP